MCRTSSARDFFSRFWQPLGAGLTYVGPTPLTSPDNGMTVICAFLQKKTSAQFAALSKLT
jgi:hypothetical protein